MVQNKTGKAVSCYRTARDERVKKHIWVAWKNANLCFGDHNDWIYRRGVLVGDGSKKNDDRFCEIKISGNIGLREARFGNDNESVTQVINQCLKS